MNATREGLQERTQTIPGAGLARQAPAASPRPSEPWAMESRGTVPRRVAYQSAARILLESVDYEATLTIEGSGEQQEAGIVLSGSGRAAGSFAFDPEAGALAAGGETTEMRMVALVSAEGQNLIIPIVQSRSETITLVEPEAAVGE